MCGFRRARSVGLFMAPVLAAMLVAAGCGDETTPQRKLVFTVQPSDAEAGVPIAPAIVVEIQDESGGLDDTATDNVTLAVTGGAVPLLGTATRAAVAGVATFNDISIEVMGAGYTLDATALDVTSATSDPFNITCGPKAALAFTVQPSDTPAGFDISPAIEVEIQDLFGNVVTTAADDVALEVTGGVPALGGTTAQAADAGVATFGDISIDVVGADYTLEATASGLATATSALFDIQQIVGQVFINELHYNNQGGEANEGFEIAGPADTDLAGWTVELYDGNKGTSYGTVVLSGTITDQQNGYGTLWFAQAGLENGAPDGLALVNASSTVVQFVSYEGKFDALDGPAVGMRSADIGVSETGHTPAADSLQLSGTGTTNVYEDFTWQAPLPNTAGAVNTGQTFQP